MDVPVIDNRVCERWHRSNGINVVIYDEMMCAGYRGGGKDSCQVGVVEIRKLLQLIFAPVNFTEIPVSFAVPAG